jgi:hypothetical protein
MKDLLIVVSMGVGALGFSVGSTSCTGSGQVRSEFAGSQPELVWAQAGVWVVPDSDWPIFYTDNYYWLYSGGSWYSSSYYWGGWGYIQPSGVPAVFTGIGNPYRYQNYHGRNDQRRQPAPVPPQYRERDHRSRTFEAPPRRDNREPLQQPHRTNERVPSRRGQSR